MTAADMPAPSPLTAEFWAAAARGELVRPVCRSCGRSFFTPQIACPYCLAIDWRYQVSDGRGVLYSHAVVRRPPVDGMSVPYVLAIVDLDEGWSMLTNLTDCAPENARIGMRVAVTWRTDGTRQLPVFRPVSGVE
jgi:uncharacterized OB-fold protein